MIIAGLLKILITNRLSLRPVIATNPCFYQKEQIRGNPKRNHEALRAILAHSTCGCKSKTKQKSFYQSYLMCLKILHKEFYEIGQIFAIFEDSISKKKYNEIEQNFFS